MSKKIAIQAGHLNTKNNCDPSLRTSTGAAGEVQVNEAVANKLFELLSNTKNIEAYLYDATANCDATIGGINFDLFLALHCDGNNDKSVSGGFAGVPDKAIDAVYSTSKKYADIFNDNYFNLVGIPYVNRETNDSKYYYMWNVLSRNTPCVLLEMGFISGTKDSKILKDTDKVANAIYETILKIFNLENSENTTDCEDAKQKAEYYDKARSIVGVVDDKWSKMEGRLKNLVEYFNQPVIDCEKLVNMAKEELSKEHIKEIEAIQKDQADAVKKLNTENEKEIASIHSYYKKEIDKLINTNKSATVEGLKEVGRWLLFYGISNLATFGFEYVTGLNIDPMLKMQIELVLSALQRFADAKLHEDYSTAKKELKKLVVQYIGLGEEDTVAVEKALNKISIPKLKGLSPF